MIINIEGSCTEENLVESYEGILKLHCPNQKFRKFVNSSTASVTTSVV